jgi:hypothetical protein
MKRLAALSLLLVVTCAVVPFAQTQAPARPASADFVAPGPAVPLAAPLMAAIGGLRAASLSAHIAFLASPSLEGRGLGGRGLDGAAEYVAAQLALAGVSPVSSPGTGNPALPYFHPVPLREISHPSGHVIIETRRGDTVDTRTFLGGVDVLFPELPPEVFSAPVVFAGYGIRESSPARDDYRDLDVKGKVVLLYAGVPPGPEWQRPDLVSRYGAESGRPRFAAKAQLAATLGARVVLAIEGPAFVSKVASGADAPAPVFFMPFEGAVDDAPPVVCVTAGVADSIFAPAGLTGASASGAPPHALAGVTATVKLGGDERLVMSRNVIGMIRGSDPVQRDEAVVIGAHLDHLGRSGDRMYPGADDNASGVSALLELARAFAASGHAPRRSLVFAFWTGEEEGHLGSVHYARHPMWPLERTSVYLNLDMIGHPWTAGELKTLVEDTRLERGAEFLAAVKPADFIELGVAEWASDLAPVLVQAARATGLALHLDWTDGKNGGSDYRAFARKGRPFVRFFGNYFDGYHEPIDTVEKLDAAQVLKMARLALASAWLLADR